MKKIFFTALLLCLTLSLPLAAQKWDYVEAKELTIVGKLYPDTPHPYHRLDTTLCKSGFTSGEINQVTQSAGVAVAFETDSPMIAVCPEFGKISSGGTTGPVSQKGFDLYIRESGEWMWAGSVVAGENDVTKTILANKKEGISECLLYFPLTSSVESLKIGVKEGSTIRAVENPFRGRIAIFGSSFTHGISTSRPGMAYPAQLSRMTGLQFLSLGCSGNSKLQTYFAHALADAPEVDAFVFDSFSNPSPQMIQERLFEFIEIIQAKYPDVPLIFQKTIYRERRNFDTGTDKNEAAKMEMAEKMMKEACKKYKNVYYITDTCATAPNHETSVDGTHPGDYGYQLWAESVSKPIVKILKKYGIK